MWKWFICQVRIHGLTVWFITWSYAWCMRLHLLGSTAPVKLCRSVCSTVPSAMAQSAARTLAPQACLVALDHQHRSVFFLRLDTCGFPLADAIEIQKFKQCHQSESIIAAMFALSGHLTQLDNCHPFCTIIQGILKEWCSFTWIFVALAVRNGIDVDLDASWRPPNHPKFSILVVESGLWLTRIKIPSDVPHDVRGHHHRVEPTIASTVLQTQS